MRLLAAVFLAAALAGPARAHVMGKNAVPLTDESVPPDQVALALKQALAQYGSLPGLAPIIQSVNPSIRFTPQGFHAFFHDFLPLRAEAARTVQKFVERHPDRTPDNIQDLPDAELEARLDTFMRDLAKEDGKAAGRLRALLPRLEAAHNEVMDSGAALSNVVMKGDEGGRFLMVDKAQHDQNWAAHGGDSPAPWQYMAREDLLNGDKEGALAAARRAAELDPGDAKSLALLSSAYYDLKNYPAAVAAARAALELDPKNATAQAVVKLARDPAQASVATPASSPSDAALGGLPIASVKDALTPPLSAAQEQSLALARAAAKALDVGDLASAEQAARRAIQLSPNFAHGYGLLGFAEAKEGRLEESLQASARGLRLNAADGVSHDARLLALNKAGRYQEALAAGAVAVEADPKAAFARYMNAAARYGLGDGKGALEELRLAGLADSRYMQFYQAAQNGDMSLLFPEVARKLAPPAKPALPRVVAIIAGAAAGGLLLGLGLLGLARRRRARALADAAAASEPQPTERRLLGGQFEFARRIGQGGMGTVFEGTDVKLHRRVAIKRMRDELRFDAGLRARFVTEAKLVAALSHPNIVALYSIVDEGDELSLIFEFVQGRTLSEIIAKQGTLSFGQALSVLRGVCDALTAAHARGIIHRDLKPSNIMITAEGAPKVMDFGVARAAKDALSRNSLTNTIVGTPPYMAPEQEQGAVRVESDVYALAVCLYEALSGTLPFGGTSGGMLMAKINKSFVPISRVAPTLPPGLDAVFDKAFEPDPDLRYRTVAELRAALEALPVAA